MNKKIISLLAIFLILSMLMTSCAKKDTEEDIQMTMPETQTEKVSEETTRLPETSVSEKAEEPESEVYSKFSGMPVTATENNKRPFAVMLDNHPDARMQAGFREADMVFEMVVEGTYTRYMVLFHSKHPVNVGPIRSARKYFVDRMLEYDAIYTHFGGSSEATDYIAQNGYNDIDGMIVGSDTIWRDIFYRKICSA